MKSIALCLLFVMAAFGCNNNARTERYIEDSLSNRQPPVEDTTNMRSDTSRTDTTVMPVRP